MLISILLTAALAAAPQAPSQAADARAQAEQLAHTGSYRAALQKFEAIAAANPDDVEARVWIATLYGWLGDERRAADVFQSIVATHPNHVAALVGLGRTLTQMGRLREAAAALERAEAITPEGAAVLAAQGRLHAEAGRTTLALAYYERAIALEPGSDSVRRELEELRAARAHRVELGYSIEHFDVDVTDPQAGMGTVNAAVSDEVRVSGTVQHQRKFSRSETRGGGGVEWQPRRSLRVHAGALFGGDARILPRADGYGGIAYAHGRATWSFDVRVADFDDTNVNVAGAGLRVAPRRSSAVWVRYYRFDTDYAAGRSDIVHSWVAGASGRVAPDWTLGVEYTHGPDHLEILTIDRTGAFDANTVAVFADFRLAPMLSLDLRYDYQSRPEEVQVHRGTVRLVQRF